MRAALWSFSISSLASMFIVLFSLSGCAGRVETMRYEPDTIPPWIQQEWRNAQDELLRLPGIPQDPRRFSPRDWEWVQLDKPFTHSIYGNKKLRGITIYDPPQIIICCGRRDTVRHEAFHAMLKLMNDPRYEQHYPELKELME